MRDRECRMEKEGYFSDNAVAVVSLLVFVVLLGWMSLTETWSGRGGLWVALIGSIDRVMGKHPFGGALVVSLRTLDWANMENAPPWLPSLL